MFLNITEILNRKKDFKIGSSINTYRIFILILFIIKRFLQREMSFLYRRKKTCNMPAKSFKDNIHISIQILHV